MWYLMQASYWLVSHLPRVEMVTCCAGQWSTFGVDFSRPFVRYRVAMKSVSMFIRASLGNCHMLWWCPDVLSPIWKPPVFVFWSTWIIWGAIHQIHEAGDGPLCVDESVYIFLRVPIGGPWYNKTYIGVEDHNFVRQTLWVEEPRRCR